MNILHEDCDPTLAKDTKLPYNTYVVEYNKEDRIAYDIAMSCSSVEVFDQYYDKYKKILNFLSKLLAELIQRYGTIQSKRKHQRKRKNHECLQD